MQKLPSLKAGDLVEIVAPAARCSKQHIIDLKELLCSWGLNCFISDEIFGSDILCANNDLARFTLLKNALANTSTQAVICARGGYGSMRLIPQLNTISSPPAT